MSALQRLAGQTTRVPALAETRGRLSTVVLVRIEGAPDLLTYSAAPDQLQRAEQLDIRSEAQARSDAAPMPPRRS